ncbi:hypothetical protein LINGRAPRIM_LOCUS3190 [Linum grandiflorum]
MWNRPRRLRRFRRLNNNYNTIVQQKTIKHHQSSLPVVVPVSPHTLQCILI